MRKYDKNGLSFSYPDYLIRRGDFPALLLTDSEGRNMSLSIRLFSCRDFERNPADFDLDLEKLRRELPADESFEIIRRGEHPLKPGARELLIKSSVCGSISYAWMLSLPFTPSGPLKESPSADGCLAASSEAAIVEIEAFGADRDFLEEIWAPLLATMSFDPSRFVFREEPERLKTFERQSFHWEDLDAAESRSFRHDFLAGYRSVLFSDSAAVGEPSVSEEDSLRHISKKPGQATVFLCNGPELALDFHLNKEPAQADDPRWDHIVEGIISLASGRLCLTADVEPELEVFLRPGNYRFMIMAEGLSPAKIGREHWHVYFRPTEEAESDEIRVVKRYPYGCGPL